MYNEESILKGGILSRNSSNSNNSNSSNNNSESGLSSFSDRE